LSISQSTGPPAWLAIDFSANRRHALIVAQVIKLCQKRTDDAVTMVIKLMGKLFSQANNRKKQRQMDCRANTAKALRMFLDTITNLKSPNDYGRNALRASGLHSSRGRRGCGAPGSLLSPLPEIRSSLALPSPLNF
jgi:hypothetical protein